MALVSPSVEWFRIIATEAIEPRPKTASSKRSTIFSPILYCRWSAKMPATYQNIQKSQDRTMNTPEKLTVSCLFTSHTPF